MAANEVYMNYGGLQEKVTKLDAQINELKAAGTAIDSIMNSLEAVWRGNSHNKTMETYNSGCREIVTRKVPEAVDALRVCIMKCREALAEVDGSMG